MTSILHMRNWREGKRHGFALPSYLAPLCLEWNEDCCHLRGWWVSNRIMDLKALCKLENCVYRQEAPLFFLYYYTSFCITSVSYAIITIAHLTPYLLLFKNYSFIHMCIHCLGHFSPLPPTPTRYPPSPSVVGRSCSAFIISFVEEKRQA
jgi:hypothetical protein